MPVPKAMMPNPSQIQFTSGFTTICSVAVCAAIIVGAATLIDRATALGALGVITAIAVQRALNLRPAPRAVIIGIRQTLLGLGIVAATAIGVLWS